MSYKSEKIGIVVTDQINRNLFLPDIQREFVWSSEKITKLFDSVLRRYPISSFLFWKLGDGQRNSVDAYALLQDYTEGQVHTSNIATDGIPDPTMVLDGQQRLTSLLIGLCGSFTMKKKWKRRKSTDAWDKKRLYLNLLKNPEDVGDDGEQGLRYGLEFFEDPPANDEQAYWLPVGVILNYPEQDKFLDFKYDERVKLHENVTKDIRQLNVFEKNLDRLYQCIWSDEAVAYHVETDTDSDRVLDIFVRTNDGGVQLSKSDLLLSMITANWSISAKSEIQGLVELINSGLERRNEFNKDFVLKTCLVLCDFNVRYKVENFNGANLAAIEQNWTEIRESIVAGVKLINAFGIDRDTLTSANAVIPVIYYLFKSGAFRNVDLLIGGHSTADANRRRAIRQWLTLALLGKVFGRNSDHVLTRARAAIKAHLDAGQNNFPLAELNKAVDLVFDAEDFLDIRYNDKVDFLALSLLYDQDNWGLLKYHRDHIFPSSRFGYFYGVNMPGTQQQDYREEMDSVANLELLVEPENIGKSDKEFETWLQSRDASFRSKHLIPDDNDLLVFTRFLDFIEAREHLIRDRLRALGIVS
jgi:uncharacterized protein with ParB-like and HNH nuclease domain